MRSRTTFTRDPSVPIPTPPPTPRELVDVIGVGRTEVVDGRALTLLSLERYREADVVTFRIARYRSGPSFASPMLRIAVAGAEAPRVWMMGGSGGGVGGDEFVWRMSWALAPPTPRDRTFTIEVTRIDWTTHDHAAAGAMTERTDEAELGPWRFDITPP